MCEEKCTPDQGISEYPFKSKVYYLLIGLFNFIYFYPISVNIVSVHGDKYCDDREVNAVMTITSGLIPVILI